MIKKLLALFLTLSILISFTACENTNESSNISSNVLQSQASSDTNSQNSHTVESASDLADDDLHSSVYDTTNDNKPLPLPQESSNDVYSSNFNAPSTDYSSEPESSTTSSPSFDEQPEKVVLPPIIDTYQEEYRPYYLLGNCRNLKDNPLVVLLFIDDDESCWSADEVTAYTNNYINEGLAYLETKAKEWNVDLKFTVKSYSTPLSDYTLKYEGSVIKDLRINGSSKDVLDQAAYDMGYSSNWELYSKFKTEHGNYNDIIFLTLINKAGKSYTRHDISTGRTSYSEHCVLFSNYLEGDSFGCRASTVAHEILHLFGAEDFYNGFREVLAYQKYPKDIMLWMPKEAYENEIGDFTAYTIGWTDTIPQICYNEYWWK